jgi:hypothetical protein
MALTITQIATIARQVYRQFPEVRDARPAVQSQAIAKDVGVRPASRYLLTFRGRGRSPGGQFIPRIVRVVADDRGKVLKISTSR